MITQLTIKNFGLIDELSLEFPAGLTVFTGETGAGKSILIDALRYGLGERLDSELIRDPARPCTVETVLTLTEPLVTETPLLRDYLTDDDRTLIISRTHLPEGKTRNRINGQTVTTAQLKAAGDLLVDFHGTNDHQMLLSESSHLLILDRLSDLGPLLDTYADRYRTYTALCQERNALHADVSARERELDTLATQIAELDQVPLEQEAYDELLRTRARLENAEKLYACGAAALGALETDGTGIVDALGAAFPHLKTLQQIDPSTVHLTDTIARMQADAQELAAAIHGYLDDISYEPQEAQEIHARYDRYYAILRKYGPTIDEAKGYREKIRRRYQLLAHADETSEALDDKIAQTRTELEERSRALSAKRVKTARALKKTIETELRELGIQNVLFECRISPAAPGPRGSDRVAFYLSPNTGEDVKPLAQIVSSGEAARVMLALKKALTRVDPIPVLIFDEIDAQIGGRLGQITGKKLKELSANRQIILITHLPQIASFGDVHFKVSKKVVHERTVTFAEPLTGDGRIGELAAMMSGETHSTVALQHAEDMLLAGQSARRATKKVRS